MTTYQDRARLVLRAMLEPEDWESALYGEPDLAEHIEAQVDQALSELASIVEEEYLLSKFEYIDWQIGDDDKLRVGDWVEANRQDHNGEDVAGFTAKIVKHYDNNLPMFLLDIDPKDPENSGDYASIDDAWLRGYEFARIKEPAEQRDQLSNRSKSDE